MWAGIPLEVGSALLHGAKRLLGITPEPNGGGGRVAENNELHPRERQICIDKGSGLLY